MANDRRYLIDREPLLHKDSTRTRKPQAYTVDEVTSATLTIIRTNEAILCYHPTYFKQVSSCIVIGLKNLYEYVYPDEMLDMDINDMSIMPAVAIVRHTVDDNKFVPAHYSGSAFDSVGSLPIDIGMKYVKASNDILRSQLVKTSHMTLPRYISSNLRATQMHRLRSYVLDEPTDLCEVCGMMIFDEATHKSICGHVKCAKDVQGLNYGAHSHLYHKYIMNTFSPTEIYNSFNLIKSTLDFDAQILYEDSSVGLDADQRLQTILKLFNDDMNMGFMEYMETMLKPKEKSND